MLIVEAVFKIKIKRYVLQPLEIHTLCIKQKKHPLGVLFDVFDKPIGLVKKCSEIRVGLMTAYSISYPNSLYR